jgi:hypothetical protein
LASSTKEQECLTTKLFLVYIRKLDIARRWVFVAKTIFSFESIEGGGLMRLTIQVIVMLFLSLFITINTSAESPEEIELSNGEVVQVFFEERSNGYRYEVEFENGHKYFYEETENLGYGGGSMELTNEEMDLADEAIDKYEQIYGGATTSNNSSSGNPLGIVFILFGLLGAIFPQVAWYLEVGWKLRDAEPSELALIANRVGGILASIVGLFLLLA